MDFVTNYINNNKKNVAIGDVVDLKQVKGETMKEFLDSFKSKVQRVAISLKQQKNTWFHHSRNHYSPVRTLPNLCIALV